MKALRFYPILLILLLNACKVQLLPFAATQTPEAPNYANENHWSSLPFREDAADFYPKKENQIPDSLKEVDVFYVYPTLYQNGETWNADLKNQKLNNRIDKLPVKLQASVFNANARVYAPRYRQANIAAYFSEESTHHPAFTVAYKDVKQAFEYYLEHYNMGRPIIIAGHSQGSHHTKQLLLDFFDTEEASQKLVAAYIIGFAIDSNMYEVLPICKEAYQNHCYVTWSSYEDGYLPGSDGDLSHLVTGNVCVNPLNWGVNTQFEEGNQAILLSLNKKKPYYASAQMEENYLWVNTNLPFFKRKNDLHLLDYNLFWFSIRNNVALRIENFKK